MRRQSVEEKKGLGILVERLTSQIEEEKTLKHGLKMRHADEIEEIEAHRQQEVGEEKERRIREKKSLENDITILHKNLDAES